MHTQTLATTRRRASARQAVSFGFASTGIPPTREQENQVMEATEFVKPPARLGTSPPRYLPDFLRTWIRSPRGLIILAIALVGAGLALGWNWLVAVGAAPLILSLAPCAAMCALGVCMMAKGNSSCATASPEKAEPSGSTGTTGASADQ